MVISVTSVYDRFPERLQHAAQRWYYVVDPRFSWSSRKKMEEVNEQFVDRFFEDEAEFKAYEREFFEGRIVDVCQRATKAVPEDVAIYDAHREACVKLYALIRKRRPETLVETGVYNGVSTLSMLLALERNDTGTLHSIDYSTHLDRSAAADQRAREFYERGRPSCAEPRSTTLPAGKEPGWIIPDDLHERWELRLGRSQRTLVEILPSLGTVDLYLHDSEHSTSCMLFEFELAWEWLTAGGLLVSSHVDRNDAFETFVKERGCEHGLLDYVYDLRYDEYTEPCSSGYVVKS